MVAMAGIQIDAQPAHKSAPTAATGAVTTCSKPEACRRRTHQDAVAELRKADASVRNITSLAGHLPATAVR